MSQPPLPSTINACERMLHYCNRYYKMPLNESDYELFIYCHDAREQCMKLCGKNNLPIKKIES